MGSLRSDANGYGTKYYHDGGSSNSALAPSSVVQLGIQWRRSRTFHTSTMGQQNGTAGFGKESCPLNFRQAIPSFQLPSYFAILCHQRETQRIKLLSFSGSGENISECRVHRQSVFGKVDFGGQETDQDLFCVSPECFHVVRLAYDFRYYNNNSTVVLAAPPWACHDGLSSLFILLGKVHNSLSEPGFF